MEEGMPRGQVQPGGHRWLGWPRSLDLDEAKLGLPACAGERGECLQVPMNAGGSRAVKTLPQTASACQAGTSNLEFSTPGFSHWSQRFLLQRLLEFTRLFYMLFLFPVSLSFHLPPCLPVFPFCLRRKYDAVKSMGFRNKQVWV